jgi:hypothetical protein
MAYIGASPTTSAFVTDTFNGNGSTVAFTMSVAPANTTSIIVAVSGVLQDPSTYSVSGTTLTFSAAPPAGTGNISVRFLGIPASGVVNTAYRTQTEFTATAGQTTFSVPSYTVGYIDVYRNGALLGSADFTATNGTTVVLANPASSGDLVVTESFFVSSVLNAIPATAGAVTSAYLLDASVTQAKLAAGVAGNGPAFSAYLATNQTISHNTETTIQYNTEQFDTASCFNTSTYRFTPNVAGYYCLTAYTITVGTQNRAYSIIPKIRKNGSAIIGAEQTIPAGSSNDHFIITPTTIVYANGTTDYFDVSQYVYDYTASSSTVLAGGATQNQFTGFLVRAA